jgi:CubicO group peptidase (beta-lactamase class C family)
MNKRLLSGLLAGLVVVTGCSPNAKTTLASNATSTGTGSPKTLSQPVSYWPTEGWKTCLPEQEGMSAAQLAKMFTDIQTEKMPVDGVVITRNGYIVAENYYDQASETTAHLIHSVTKSITSALVGIAIQEGKIHSVDDHVMDYFKDKTIKNMDSNKKKITIAQCLTMSAGLDWHEESKDLRTNDQWMNDTFYNSMDPLQTVLDRPVNKDEMNVFNYNTGLPELMSAIIQKQTNLGSMSQFADEKVFKPLGITSADWPTDRSEESYGGTAMSMTARDMAKFGFLYLNKGNWNGQQVVPEKWVETSTTSHVKSSIPDVGYGYYWWVQTLNGHPMYEAMGAYGQYIAVVPDLNLVVSLTSHGQDVDSLLTNYIIPAVQSSGAIPEDAAADAKLKSLTAQKS